MSRSPRLLKRAKAESPGGECAECRRKRLLGERSPVVQRGVALNPPGDRCEQEAEHIAEQVMRAPDCNGQAHRPASASRRCECAADADRGVAPPIVHDALRSPGRPLESATRSFMEERFGHDFSHVRVHANERAGASARAIAAAAYTVGHDVVLASGSPALSSAAGRELLAHELVHVVQQENGGHRVQRRLSVNSAHPSFAPAGDPAAALAPAQRLTMMDNLVQALCPDFEVEAGTGDVLTKSRTSPDRAALAAGSHPAGCCCLAVLTDTPNHWTIEVSQVLGPHTLLGSRQVVLSPTTSPVEFGSFTAAGTLAFQGAVPAAGHELCGHAALEEIGAHPPTQSRLTTDVHDPTVRLENVISTEQGVPASSLRGLAASGTHRGESVDRLTVGGYPLNASAVGTLPAAERSKLDFAADYVVANNSFVDIIGHSDSAGSSAAKNKISKDRADKAKTELVAKGVPPAISKHGLVGVGRFTRVAGVGDTQPPPPPLNANQANWRRVEILIAGFPAGAQVPPPGTPTTVTPHTVAAAVPALKASVDPCESLLANRAYP